MIKLTVNGRPTELEMPQPLLEYLAALGVNPQAVAVEINGQLLQRSDYSAGRLNEGDVVEIVRMVGGG
ncbi:MAG: sulfur carrier protein ThiS [Candidatus Dormibacteraceae bacterium]